MHNGRFGGKLPCYGRLAVGCDIETPKGELEFTASCKGFWSGIFGGRCAGAPGSCGDACLGEHSGAPVAAGHAKMVQEIGQGMITSCKCFCAGNSARPRVLTPACAGFTSVHTKFKDFDSYKFCAGKHGMFVKKGKRGFAVGGGCKGKALAALQLTEDEDDD